MNQLATVPAAKIPSPGVRWTRWSHHAITMTLGPIKSVARFLVVPAACVLFAVTGKAVEADELRGADFFEAKIRPLLIEHCYDCHSADAGEPDGEFRLDVAGGAVRGGSLGPAVIPGKPAASLMMLAVEYRHGQLQMPPDYKLEQEQIESIRKWIEMGAPDPRQESAQEGAPAADGATPLDRDPQSHWAFVPPVPATTPDKVAADSRDVIDAIAASQAAAAAVSRAARADRGTLIRRLYFDLTGLPPSYSEVEQFVHSDRPDAYARLTDRLLASPEFGERWGRHWLDVARYADTIGYTTAGKERRLVGSERYRDWTIEAFSADLPYDEMIRRQLAADRIDPDNAAGQLDAMGFITIGRQFGKRNDTIDDQIDVVTRGLLGLTVTCARCHDHKFDPIASADYYSLYGIFNSSETPGGDPSPLRMVDDEEPRDSHVFRRGQEALKGPIAPRQYLTALRQDNEPRFSDGSGRWELANRIASSDNPLTARVMVNRIWAHLIGRPLVETPSDFGFRTEPPAVQDLLDELAHDFAQHWSVKRTIRRIVLSRVYQQAAEVDRMSYEQDPDNRLLTRANRRRRDFESMRDSMLQTCGLLERVIGGSPVEITSPTPAPRRTLYAMIDRQNLPQLFRTFDFASPDTHSPERYYTTVPQQSLYLLNNQQMFELARLAASEVRQNAGDGDQRKWATLLVRRLLGRDPSNEELNAFAAFLAEQPAEMAEAIDARSLWSYGTATFSDDGVTNFQPLAYFEGSQWQGGKNHPDASPLGYVSLGRENGHPGRDASAAVVRRWTAPLSGRVKITGMMGHRNKQGDGIIANIWAGPKRLFRGVQKSNNRPFGPLSAEIAAGQTVDFVAAPGESDSYDSFFLRVRLSLTSKDGEVVEADSVKDFSGPFATPSNEPLDRLAQLAQVLLMSNEFSFID